MIRYLLSLSLLFLPFISEAKQKVCLNMIVKDESQVIRRCLDSVKPLIDYWVIVDTGSTDDTKKIIRAYLKGIPGELHERPWKNFGENRTEAFELAKGKGDYILFMDADDTLEFEGEAKFPSLSKDLYHMVRGTKSFTYLKPQLVKAALPWKWVGVTHEYLDCSQSYTSETLKKVRYVSGDGGASSYDPKKFLKNVKLLEEGLKKEPHNSRYAFYLAESYRDAGDKGKALEWFQKRASMGGWEEEIFWSKLQIAHILRDMGLVPNIVIESYLDAHNYRSHRVEPIYYLAQYYIALSNHAKAYEWLKKRETLAKSPKKDSLFNEDWIEDYGLLFQLSLCSYYVGQYQECLDACNKLLTIKDLPESWHKQVDANRKFPLTKLSGKKGK